MDLPWNLTMDLMGRYVSRLPAFDVDAYVEADVRLAWRHAASGLEAAVVGQNLHRRAHEETQTADVRSEMGRAAYLSVTWRH